MMTRLVIAALVGLGGMARAAETSRPTDASTADKKLIEFGWDEPDPAFMRAHADQLDGSPFDGCVFHVNYSRPGGQSGNFTWAAWGRQAFTLEDVRPAIDDLKAAPLKRMRHNFLRFNTTPADIDWFDDHAAVINNARLAATIAREGGCPGLLFDIEQYNGQLFNYAKQRDAATRSWDQYAAQARLRGREVMEAFQDAYPDLTVFLTFGYCLPWGESQTDEKKLAACGYGLLKPFIDGMVDAIRGRTKLVDGNESAYSYREEKKFRTARRLIREDVLAWVPDREKYRRHISVSFGLWMDYDWRKQGWNTDDPEKNPVPPKRFEQLVRTALQYADEYVWVYTETPRWWSDEGKPVKLPPAYDAAVRAARAPATSPE